MSAEQAAQRGAPTIESVASRVLADVAPGQERYLGVTAGVIFGGGTASKRAIQAALAPSRRTAPTAFGAHEVQYIVGFVLAVLSGTASNVLTAQAGGSLSWLHARWRAWRQRKAIAAKVAPEGLAAPLPKLTAVQAAQVGAAVLLLARRAGISEEPGQRVATLIAAALTGQ
jgi:hypothetical protein